MDSVGEREPGVVDDHAGARSTRLEVAPALGLHGGVGVTGWYGWFAGKGEPDGVVLRQSWSRAGPLARG